MTKPISLKSISTARQELLVCMHEKQFGTIRRLPIVDGEPVLRKAKVTRLRNLNKQTTAKPVSRNFNLKAAQLRLLETLDEIDDGMLKRITFREGLPCELEQCAI